MPSPQVHRNFRITTLGSWSHPTRGTWNFLPDGTGTLVRDSVNGIPGRYTITLRWAVEPGNMLAYTPVRNTLVGSPDSDRNEPIASPKTYRAPFEVDTRNNRGFSGAMTSIADHASRLTA